MMESSCTRGFSSCLKCVCTRTRVVDSERGFYGVFVRMKYGAKFRT